MKLSSYGLVLFAGLFALTNACGGDDDDSPAGTNGAGTGAAGTGTGGAGGGQAGPAANCSGRCAAKAGACMLPAEFVTPYCQQLCGESPTEGQLTCLEGTSCEALIGAQNPLALCPAGNQGQAGSGQGQAGSGQGQAGSGSGSKAALGEVCDCGGPQLCLDTEKGPCEGDLTCLDFGGNSTNPAFLGFCSQKCASPTGQSDCPTGYTCTKQIFNDADFGNWCRKP